MKNLLLIAMATCTFACTSKTEKTSAGGDSMHSATGIEDTVVNPQINGYAPPNAKIDTSKELKDSIEQRKKQ